MFSVYLPHFSQRRDKSSVSLIDGFLYFSLPLKNAVKLLTIKMHLDTRVAWKFYSLSSPLPAEWSLNRMKGSINYTYKEPVKAWHHLKLLLHGKSSPFRLGSLGCASFLCFCHWYPTESPSRKPDNDGSQTSSSLVRILPRAKQGIITSQWVLITTNRKFILKYTIIHFQ